MVRETKKSIRYFKFKFTLKTISRVLLIGHSVQFTDDTVDLLEALGVSSGQARATEVVGRCGPLGTRAFRLTGTQSPLGVNTRQLLFPDTFPRDFSLLAAIRLAPNTSIATLFALYRYESVYTSMFVQCNLIRFPSRAENTCFI